MAEKSRQNARAEVEKAETPEAPEAATPGETPPARQNGNTGAQKAAPWPSAESRKGRD